MSEILRRNGRGQTCRGGASPCGMHKRHFCNGSRPDDDDRGRLGARGTTRGGDAAANDGTISFLTARDPTGPWRTFEAKAMYANGTGLRTSGNNPYGS